MFFTSGALAYTVRVDNPNPMYARLLQQAIGGPEGEMRVMNQYLFQGFNARGPVRYRDMLISTGTEEGRTLAARLFEATDDPGMKDMWRF